MKRLLLVAILSIAPLTLAQTCQPPNYCSYTGTDIKSYSGTQNVAPLLNQSFTDPAFNQQIWRWSDTTTDTGHATIGPAWNTGNFAAGWSQDEKHLLFNTSRGGTILMNASLTNPRAPVVSPTPCSYTGSAGSCISGKIYPNAGGGNPKFSTVSGETNITYQVDFYGKLLKWDWSNTFSSGSAAPTVNMVFDPYASGHCLNGQTNGGQGFMVSSDSGLYFWGWGPAGNQKNVMYKSGESNCIMLDSSTSAWTLSGSANYGGFLGTLTWIYDDGTPATSPGAYSPHDTKYDERTQMWHLEGAGSNYPIRVSLTTGKAILVKEYGFGHGFGIVDTGTGSGFLSTGMPNSYAIQYFYKPFAVPPASDATVRWAIYGHFTHNGPDNPGTGNDAAHGSHNTEHTLPFVGAIGDTMIWGGTGAYTVPPLNNWTIYNSYEQEILLAVCPSRADSCTNYRVAHHYSATGGYNSGGNYWAGVMTALSPDKCWVMWGSNWMGHLGDATQSPPTNTCTQSANCRVDVFATYLCGPAKTVSSITVSPSSATISVGGTKPLTASASWSDGNVTNITGACSWATSKASVASVSNAVVTGVTAGRANVRCGFRGIASNLVAITVGP